MRFPRPAGMPVPGDPGLHLEGTKILPPGAWLIGGRECRLESVARVEKSRSRAPRGAPAGRSRPSPPAIRRWTRPRGGSGGAAYPHQRLSAFCSPLFFREREKDKGVPGPPPTGRRSVGSLTIEDAVGRAKRSVPAIASCGGHALRALPAHDCRCGADSELFEQRHNVAAHLNAHLTPCEGTLNPAASC